MDLPLDFDIYLKGKAIVIKKALCRFKKSPHAWFRRSAKFIITNGKKTKSH